MHSDQTILWTVG